MFYRKVFISIFALCVSGQVVAGADQCLKVDCDCSIIQDAKWRSVCEQQEQRVRSECVVNSGVIKSYCGLHGPSAYPVAISLKTAVTLGELTSADAEALEKQIKTQSWSLQDSFKQLKAKEASGGFGDASQLLALYERDIDRQYELEKQLITHLMTSGKADKARGQTEKYSEDVLQSASNINQYSDELWQKFSAAKDPRYKKAYKVMSLRLARLAANVYEQAGDLLGAAGAHKESATAWQMSAEVARKLINLESATENKARHIEFYQAQATARFHRATYYWLLSDEGNHQLANESARLAKEISGSADDGQAVVEAGHEVDTQDMRAMKRPSR